MALIDIKLFSTILKTNVDVRVIMPTPDEPFYTDDTPYYKNGYKYQVLYLLHGAHGDCTVWSRNTGIERYAQAHKLIVVCPSVTNSCYLNMAYGGAFMDFVTMELPTMINYTFPVSQKREDTFIAGMSMGGYGAWRIALEHPERFNCAVSLSGGLLIGTNKPLTKGAPSSISMKDVFGEGEAAERMMQENNLLNIFKKRIEEGVELPRWFQCVGTEDFTYEGNQEMKKALEELGVDLTYDEGPGIHNWDYWDPELRKILDTWMPLKNELIKED
jgi:putative tributyrin esterase